ncbi:MAG: M28 family peptidase [Acidobacteriia bacterium]|mgnify:CR=1 FL=1|nr:M28 family peptidase [Terriglobia bacterium]
MDATVNLRERWKPGWGASVLSWVLTLVLMAGGCQPQSVPASGAPVTAAADQAPPPEQTGGFDGNRALAHVAELVRFGPRIPGTEAARRAQAYIRQQLESYGCAVEEFPFTAQTPLGPVPMKNILVRIAGRTPDALLLLTHYDTKRTPPGFLGANDGGSSTGLMLEMARLLCPTSQPAGSAPRALSVWIAFLDGEEAQVEWTESDSLYGSRELAARLALRGELERVRAVILADMVGDRELRFLRELNSTDWLVDLVWDVAERLGYGHIFVNETHAIEDDHLPFVRRGIPAVDIVEVGEYPYWHTREDTLDKLSARSLAITGHVILESLAVLEQRLR